jgi:hypothetical protein
MTDLFPTVGRAKAQIDWPEPDADIEEGAITCPTCSDAVAIELSGTDEVCMRCGTVVNCPLEQSAEYRWFSSESGGSDPSRCSFPVNHLLPESSLGTIILNGKQSAVMRSIKRYHMWNMMPYRERTLWSIFESLQVRASNAGISTAVIEESKELFAQLTAVAICRGQGQRDAMLAACLWEALKRHGTPRMPKNIGEIFNLPIRHVTKGIKQFQSLFAVRTNGHQTDTYTSPAPKVVATGNSDKEATERAIQRRAVWQKTASPTTSYRDFIQPFLTNLSIPRHAAATLEATVFDVCARIEELGIVPENTPPSLTASVITFCSQEMGIRIDIAEIARVCGISVVTIQKCLKRIVPMKEKLLIK